MHDDDKDDDLPRHPTEDELAQMAIAHGINRDELAVAITRDGRVYVGKAIPPTKLQKTVIESRFLTRLFRLVGKADHFFFTRLLRLPYFLDWMRKVRATRLQKRSGVKP